MRMHTKTVAVQLLSLGLLHTGHVHGDLVQDFVSNVQEGLKPVQSVAEHIVDSAAPVFASIADQAGTNALSIISDVAKGINSHQDNQIAAELSSYHNGSSTHRAADSFAMFSAIVAALCMATAIAL
ncbi:hypothetical protein GQ54DRAFT_298820 [Martensiomyces pterosporus]|nr:hypothetical protein GQ54DRAFT_298820 [Martensiomyces pterosporus]